MQVKVDEARSAQDAAERDAAAARRAAARAQAYTLEVERLTDDNALLANRLEQMELDLKWVAAGAVAGAGSDSQWPRGRPPGWGGGGERVA
jgi:hypothetical protein